MKERRIVQACMRGLHALGTVLPCKIARQVPYEIAGISKPYVGGMNESSLWNYHFASKD